MVDIGAGPTTESLWRSFNRKAHELLDDVGEDIQLDLGYVAGFAAFVAAVIVLLCRLVQTFTVDRGGGVLGWTGGGLITLVAFSALVVLVWIYWQTRLDVRDGRWYAVALIWSILVIGLAVEAFAGTTTLLWHNGVVDAASGRGPSLWAAEQFYLWHLVDAVPLLSIPDTLGWAEPVEYDASSGPLLLAFQLVLIAPLVRIGLGAYQIFEVGIVGRRAKERELASRGVHRTYSISDPPSAAVVWGTVARLAALLLVGGVLLIVLADPRGVVNRRLDEWTERGVDVGDRHFSLDWVSAIPPILAVAGFVLVFALVYLSFEFRGLTSVDRAGTAAGAAAAYLFVVALVVVTGATAALAALRLGIADADPPIRGSAWPAVTEAFSWHIVDAFPGPDVTATLRWEPDHDLRGSMNGTLILLAKLATFCVLLFPFARAVRSYSHHSRRRPPALAALAAARRFDERLRAAEEAVSAYARSRSGPAPSPAIAVGDDRPRFPGLVGAEQRFAARQAVDQVVVGLDELVALFGTSEVTAAADAAAGTLSRWYQELARDHWGFGFEPLGQFGDPDDPDGGPTGDWPTLPLSVRLPSRPLGSRPARGPKKRRASTRGLRDQFRQRAQHYRQRAADALRNEGQSITSPPGG